MRTRAWSLAVALLAACSSGRSGTTDGTVTGGGSNGSGTGGGGTDTGGALALPPANALIDYQLGGAYAPPAGVTVVSRDRGAQPAAGLYNICYVNGFQIQPEEKAFWDSQHADLILRDAQGHEVVDADWGETLIDVRTPARQAAVADIVGEWIAGCKSAGFDAVEIDNLDSHTRSQGLLSADEAVATMRLLADRAHALGMPVAQKNAAEMVDRRADMATDFAIAEECNRYSECGVYTAAYGDHVLVIEYRQQDYDQGCAAYPGLSIVLRDLDLVAPGSPGYVYSGC